MKPIQIDLARVADVPFWRAYELRWSALPRFHRTPRAWSASWPTSRSVVPPIAIAPCSCAAWAVSLGLESY